MADYIVNGGVHLYGRVEVSGSKNSALPIIFASLVTHGISVVENFTDIGDTRVALDIVSLLGVKYRLEGKRLTLDTSELTYAEIPDSLTARLRASTYLLGSLASRFGMGEISRYGGCSFSARPIDLHLYALRQFGATVEDGRIEAERLHPALVSFRVVSVGATVNALILAAGIKGESHLYGIAIEPHILDLIAYLRSAGARIILDGNNATVYGAELHGGNVTLGGDMIEAGTFLVLSSLMDGGIGVGGVDRSELLATENAFSGAGVSIINKSGYLYAANKPKHHINLVTGPFPGFPTDLQPIFSVLMSFLGGSITDNVWSDRFGYLAELSAFGIRSRRVGNSYEIFPSEINPAVARAPDLRGGAALLLSALLADGESRIGNAEIIERGYERLIPKLSDLGAEIRRV